MTGRFTSAQASASPAVEKFPDFPPRDDMMNTRHLHDQGHQASLRRHLGNPDSTIVMTRQANVTWTLSTAWLTRGTPP